MREKIKKWAEEKYTHGRKLESVFLPEDVTVEGEIYKGAIVFGDEDCFDSGDFYQYLLYGDKLYRAYYNCDDVEDLCDIDYSTPREIRPADDIIDLLLD